MKMPGSEYRAISLQLQEEAQALLEELGLIAVLAESYGEPVVTGSLRYGLMVWRDIDIHLPLAAENWVRWTELGPIVAERISVAGHRLHKAQFLNDYVDPHPLGAGLYWGIELVTAAGNGWKLDLWGWEPDDFARRQRADSELICALAAADGDRILMLKHDARALGLYGNEILSMDIYRFVLGGHQGGLDDLRDWLVIDRRC